MLSYFLNIFTVLTTHVGMILQGQYCPIVERGTPHACGDDPLKAFPFFRIAKYSPRMWG